MSTIWWSVKYQAIFYSITDYNILMGTDGYNKGVEIKKLGTTVYKNTAKTNK